MERKLRRKKVDINTSLSIRLKYLIDITLVNRSNIVHS